MLASTQKPHKKHKAVILHLLARKYKAYLVSTTQDLQKKLLEIQ